MAKPEILDQDLLSLLHAAPFDKIQGIWADMLECDSTGKVMRDLLRFDRFFLLCEGLNRRDILDPWLYDRCREVEANPDGFLDLWAREHYKAVALDEPVPTPVGFKRHGDLKAGDWVFGADGNPVQVLATTPVFTDADCFRVTFDDGYSVVVSGQHLWTVERKTRRRLPGTENGRVYREAVTLRTDEMARHNHVSDNRLSVPVAPAVRQIEHMLPIAPYALGLWLGDGNSGSARLTCAYQDAEIIEHLRADGHVVGERSSSSANAGLYAIDPGERGRKGTGMTAVLRGMGLIGNKHVPRDYLVASIEQRRALLQGLMDSDGHCNERGTATFVNKSAALVSGVFDLCASLGLKPRRREHKDGVFHISFQAYKEDAPFRLSRKLARCRDGEREARRFVVSVERCETVPVSCIQVSAADGLYLIGRHHVTTHNSTIITYAGIIQEILKDPEITICVFSFNKPVARKFLRQVKYELETNKTLLELFPDILYGDPRKESPRWSEDGGLVVKRTTNPKEATLEAHGLVDGQPTGAHFLLRVYDDVVTLDSVTSPEMINKTTEAWSLSDNLGARGADGMARAWHIGTRYHFGDTYNVMMEMGAVIPRIYAATADGSRDGKPVFLPPEVWEDKKKKQTSSVLAAQMLQNPAAGNNAIFRKEWLKFIDVRPSTLNVYILCDPASSKKKGSDNTAMAVIGVDAALNKYLLDGYRHKMGLSERYQAIKGLRKVWMNMPGVQSVRVGYERYGSTSDLEYFEESMQRDRDEFEIVELAWPREGPGSKIDRVQRLEPDFRNGKFFLSAAVAGETSRQRQMRESGQAFRIFTPVKRKDQDGHLYSLNKVLIEEYLTFPFCAHDDFIDAVSRIDDIGALAPIIVDERSLEPEAYQDGI